MGDGVGDGVAVAVGVEVAARVGDAAAVVVVGDASLVVVALAVVVDVPAISPVGVPASVTAVAVGSGSSEPPNEQPLRASVRAIDADAPRRSARPCRIVR